MTKSLDISSPFLSRLNAWSSDRFPVVNAISGALSYFTMVSIGRYIAHGSASAMSLVDLLGAIAFIGHLLLLRVFDEHKDYEIDLVNHPERALSRGLITLKHLRLLSLPFPIIAIFWSLSISGGSWGIATYAWAVMFIYSLLMAKEFFIGPWLTKRLVLYSFSHMLVSPLMLFWIIAGGMGSLIVNELLLLVLVISFTGGIAYELTRKTRGNEENKNLDAYNKHFGTNGSIAIITVFNLISFVLALKINALLQINPGMLSYIILALGYACTFFPTVNFLKKKTEKARKVNEGGLGLFFLGLYVSFLIALFI